MGRQTAPGHAYQGYPDCAIAWWLSARRYHRLLKHLIAKSTFQKGAVRKAKVDMEKSSHATDVIDIIKYPKIFANWLLTSDIA